MLYREKATAIGEKEALAGVREVGWNTGPRVRAYQRADGLHLDPDTGYPWCASLICWTFEKAGRPLVELGESASVGFLLAGAAEEGWVVAKPARGDCVCFYWGADSWPDHIGLVRRVKPDGTVLTVEGNTSSDDAGSQDEGDGVYLKERSPGRVRMRYFRVPGAEKDAEDARRQFEILRGKPGREAVVAVARTAEEAGEKVAGLLESGVWVVRARKRRKQAA